MLMKLIIPAEKRKAPSTAPCGHNHFNQVIKSAMQRAGFGWATVRSCQSSCTSIQIP